MVLFHQSSIILCTVKIYVMNATEGYCAVIFYEYVQITEEIVQKSIDVLVKVVEYAAQARNRARMQIWRQFEVSNVAGGRIGL